MDYKTTYIEKLGLFPNNIQDERMKSLGYVFIYRSKIDLDGVIISMKLQHKIIIKMLKLSEGNETMLTTIGVLVSGIFFVPKILDGEIKTLLEELGDLFIHNLSLPAWHSGYPSQALLVEDIIKKLNKVIYMIDNEEYNVIKESAG